MTISVGGANGDNGPIYQKYGDTHSRTRRSNMAYGMPGRNLLRANLRPVVPAGGGFILSHVPNSIIQGVVQFFGSDQFKKDFEQEKLFINLSMEDEQFQTQDLHEHKDSMSDRKEKPRNWKPSVSAAVAEESNAEFERIIMSHKVGEALDELDKKKATNLKRKTKSKSEDVTVGEEEDTMRCAYSMMHWSAGEATATDQGKAASETDVNWARKNGVRTFYSPHYKSVSDLIAMQSLHALLKKAIVEYNTEAADIPEKVEFDVYDGVLRTPKSGGIHQEFHNDTMFFESFASFKSKALTGEAVSPSESLKYGWVLHMPLTPKGLIVRIVVKDPEKKQFVVKYVKVPFGSVLLLRADVIHSGHYGFPEDFRYHAVLVKKGQKCALSKLRYFRFFLNDYKDKFEGWTIKWDDGIDKKFRSAKAAMNVCGKDVNFGADEESRLTNAQLGAMTNVAISHMLFVMESTALVECMKSLGAKMEDLKPNKEGRKRKKGKD